MFPLFPPKQETLLVLFDDPKAVEGCVTETLTFVVHSLASVTTAV